jgi:hypothetical protein
VRAADAESEELRGRVRRLRQDLDAIALLEEARLFGGIRGGHSASDRSEEEARYRKAFQGYGIDAEHGDAEAAARLRGSAIRGWLVAGLDDWARVKPPEGAEEAGRLTRLAGLADEDPWRRRLREAATRDRWDEVRRLADADEAAQQPAATLVLLAQALLKAGAPQQALAVLRRGQKRHPGDFWLNYALGRTCLAVKPARAEEAVHF